MPIPYCIYETVASYTIGKTMAFFFSVLLASASVCVCVSASTSTYTKKKNRGAIYLLVYVHLIVIISLSSSISTSQQLNAIILFYCFTFAAAAIVWIWIFLFWQNAFLSVCVCVLVAISCQASWISFLALKANVSANFIECWMHTEPSRHTSISQPNWFDFPGALVVGCFLSCSPLLCTAFQMFYKLYDILLGCIDLWAISMT